MPYIYILECADGSYYTGSTWNLEKRLWEHQNGLGANYTVKHRPVKLIYCEETERVEDAYRREKQIQGWGRKKKQALIAGETNALPRLAECKNKSHCANLATVSGAVSLDSVPFDSAQGTESRETESKNTKSKKME
jgi:putative endonuclease